MWALLRIGVPRDSVTSPSPTPTFAVNRFLRAVSVVLFLFLKREARMPRRKIVPHLLSVAALVVASSLLSTLLMAQEKQSAKVLELDHVSICGPDLDALRQRFTGVGLTPDFGGPHGMAVTQMAW